MVWAAYIADPLERTPLDGDLSDGHRRRWNDRCTSNRLEELSVGGNDSGTNVTSMKRKAGLPLLLCLAAMTAGCVYVPQGDRVDVTFYGSLDRSAAGFSMEG
ncbi:MAG: hypothetical protein R3324_12745, partial [Halobacteriales archaeon]|nr:hypothetical protein [Halobacteriales archaeon]